jgi:hypothetical protein
MSEARIYAAGLIARAAVCEGAEVTSDVDLNAPDPALFAYIQIPVPGIAYSAARIPFLEKHEDYAWYLDALAVFIKAYETRFGQMANRSAADPGPPPADYAPPPSNPAPVRPQGGSRPSQGPQNGGNNYGVRLLCGEHGNAELRPSVKNKNMDFIEDLGREIPASWFHTTPDGKTHTVYQSKAVWA